MAQAIRTGIFQLIFHSLQDTAHLNGKGYNPSKFVVSRQTSLKHFRELLKTEKVPNANCYSLISCKAAGVSHAYDQGLSEEEVRDHGGWKSLSTSLYYKRNVLGRRHKIADKMRF